MDSDKVGDFIISLLALCYRLLIHAEVKERFLLFRFIVFPQPELIAERFQKLDRVLTKMRLYRGFGALTLGGILGIPVSLIGIIQKGYGTLPAVMLAGAVLCALFAYLLFVSYRKKTS